MLCHLPLFMPAFGLALFLFLPFNLALPSYLIIVALSIVLYFKTIEAMRLPVKVGQEEMIGSIGKVVADINPEGKIVYKNELWSAISREMLCRGSRAKIIGFEGMKAVVQGLKEEKGD